MVVCLRAFKHWTRSVLLIASRKCHMMDQCVTFFGLILKVSFLPSKHVSITLYNATSLFLLYHVLYSCSTLNEHYGLFCAGHLLPAIITGVRMLHVRSAPILFGASVSPLDFSFLFFFFSLVPFIPYFMVLMILLKVNRVGFLILVKMLNVYTVLYRIAICTITCLWFIINTQVRLGLNLYSAYATAFLLHHAFILYQKVCYF